MTRCNSGSPKSPQFTFRPTEWPTFIHLDLFDEEWADLGLGDDELRDLQDSILAAPDRPPVISHLSRSPCHRGSHPGRPQDTRDEGGSMKDANKLTPKGTKIVAALGR